MHNFPILSDPHMVRPKDPEQIQTCLIPKKAGMEWEKFRFIRILCDPHMVRPKDPDPERIRTHIIKLNIHTKDPKSLSIRLESYYHFKGLAYIIKSTILRPFHTSIQMSSTSCFGSGSRFEPGSLFFQLMPDPDPTNRKPIQIQIHHVLPKPNQFTSLLLWDELTKHETVRHKKSNGAYQWGLCFQILNIKVPCTNTSLIFALIEVAEETAQKHSSETKCTSRFRETWFNNVHVTIANIYLINYKQ